MQKRLPYPPSAFLPGVFYPDSADSLFGDPVLDLEYTTLRHLEDLADAIKTALVEEGMIQAPEFLVSHFCAYLGYLSVDALGLERATALETPLLALVRSQAQEAFALFDTYPVKNDEKQQNRDNLEAVAQKSPCACRR